VSNLETAGRDNDPGLDDAAARPTSTGLDFIRQIVEEDRRDGRWDGGVVTRFPPEPNGFLHLGHAAAIALDFGIAAEYGGRCHLRFDDTNPAKEEQRFVDGMKHDLRWLGYDWGEHEYYASDYFDQLYDWAVMLINAGKAFVCDLPPDELRSYRGTLTEPGRNSPWRERSATEKPRTPRRDARWRVPGRLAHVARQNRHELTKPEYARSGHVPHFACCPRPNR
jgi:glutamyl/glutaminyl-tRNA synthetase